MIGPHPPARASSPASLRPKATEPVPAMTTTPAPKPMAPVRAMRASLSTVKLPRGDGAGRAAPRGPEAGGADEGDARVVVDGEVAAREKDLQRVDDFLAVRGMVGAGDAAIRSGDLAAGDVGGDEGFVDGALDVARGGLDSDAEMVRREVAAREKD